MSCLQKKSDEILPDIMKEYEDVMDTIMPTDFNFTPYIPNIHDVMNPFYGKQDEFYVYVIEAIHAHQIFIKCEGDYLYIPTSEVW